MLTDFIAAGYSEDLFWSLTPRQVEAHFAAARKRNRYEHNRLMQAAWFAGSVQPLVKPPRLKDMLLADEDAAPKRRQTWQEMKAALMLAIPPKRGALNPN